GPNGIVVPPIGFSGYEINTTDQAFWFLLAWAAFVSLVCWWIGRSPFGRLVAAIVIGALRPILENVPSLSSDSAVPWQTVIYGSILVAGMVFRPRGLLPEGLLAVRGFPRGAISAVPGAVQD